MINLTIPGKFFSKKNSKQIVRIGGQPRLLSSKPFRAWEKMATEALRAQYRGETISDPVHAKFLFYAPDRRKRDLSNCFEGPQDALQKAEIIKDDAQIVSLDGSRLLYDKENPRVEITLERVEE